MTEQSKMPPREIFNPLTRHDVAFIRPVHLVYFRDVYDRLIGLVEELDIERAGNLFGFYFQSAERDHEALYRVGTIFIVTTAIAGIYGYEKTPSQMSAIISVWLSI